MNKKEAGLDFINFIHIDKFRSFLKLLPRMIVLYNYSQCCLASSTSHSPSSYPSDSHFTHSRTARIPKRLNCGAATGLSSASSYSSNQFLPSSHSKFSYIESQPFELILLFFHLWMYTEQYRGALLMSTLLVKKLEELQLDQHVKKL